MFGGKHPVDAKIQHQFSVSDASGAAVTRGHRFEQIRKATSSAPAELKQEALRIMDPHVRAGDVEVTDVRTLTDNDLGLVEVDYVNLATGATLTVRG